GWQAYETRGCVLIETDKYGLVAVFTVGQGQVSSVHFAEGVVPGAKIKKGDELGYFLFGGSDCAMLFEKKAGFELTCPPAPSDDTYANGYAKVLCRAQYGVFHGEQG
ncbi:MAG TPA: phosphatidylserine decarboxylase, partial [Lachnospiraceae bacterium]|nr:phosphatidylserine decarboxylase [Lachnospiraceae bacterium]